MNGTVRHFMRL